MHLLYLLQRQTTVAQTKRAVARLLGLLDPEDTFVLAPLSDCNASAPTRPVTATRPHVTQALASLAALGSLRSDEQRPEPGGAEVAIRGEHVGQVELSHEHEARAVGERPALA